MLESDIRSDCSFPATQPDTFTFLDLKILGTDDAQVNGLAQHKFEGSFGRLAYFSPSEVLHVVDRLS